MDTIFVSIFIILAGGTAALFLSSRFVLMQRIMVGATTLGSFIGLCFALTHLSGDGPVVTATFTWLHIFALSFTADSVSLFFLIPVFLIPPLALVYSLHYFTDSKKNLRVAVNYFFTAVLIASMPLVVTASNMISFALSWEIMSIASFFLVLFDYQNEDKRKAGYLYLIFVQGGAMFLFAAFALIYRHTGSFDFFAVSSMPDSGKLLVFILALIGFGSKAGLFPLHIWMPSTYSAAPSHLPGIMSGVMAKMGIYGILRIYLLLDAPTPVFGNVVLICGILTGIFGVVYALVRQNIKELLAYSSMENIGIILIGLGIGMLGAGEGNQAMAFFGFAGALLHVFNHSVFKSLLFMGAGAIEQQTGTNSIEDLGGLLKKMPVTGKTFLIGSTAISGLPPFAGFISEFLIYYGAFQGVDTHRLSFILAIFAIISLAVIGGLATAVFTKVMGLAFLGAARTKKVEQAEEVRPSMQWVMILLAGACLFIGLVPAPFIRTAFAGIRDIAFVSSYNAQSFLTVVQQISQTAMLFVLLVLVLVMLRQFLYLNKRIRWAKTWGCGFSKPTVRMQYTGASYADDMVNFFNWLTPVTRLYSGITQIFPRRATWHMQSEDTALMNYERALVRPLYSLVYKLRWIQHGNIQLYISYIIAAIIILLVFFL
ncbi:hydrogenase [Desulfobulbus sp. TB]|nr:hydrogenase [Desulfobulbus sp. TB]